MTRPPFQMARAPRPLADHTTDLLLHALQTVIPTGLLEMLLDRIEASR